MVIFYLDRLNAFGKKHADARIEFIDLERCCP